MECNSEFHTTIINIMLYNNIILIATHFHYIKGSSLSKNFMSPTPWGEYKGKYIPL